MSQNSNLQFSQGDLFDFSQLEGDYQEADNYYAVFEEDDSSLNEVVTANFERGQNHPDWHAFGKTFKSFHQYEKRVHHYLTYVDSQAGHVEVSDAQLFEYMKSYFQIEKDRCLYR